MSDIGLLVCKVVCNTSRSLYPQKQTLELSREMSTLCQKRTSQVCAVKRFLFSDRLRRREAAGGPIFFETLPPKRAQKKTSCVRYRAEPLLVKLELCRRDGYGSLSLPEHRLSCSRLHSRGGIG